MIVFSDFYRSKSSC